MNEQIESLFVNTYIQQQYRERLLLELKDTSTKTHKRSCNAFKKFSHKTVDYVIPRLVAASDKKLTEGDVLSFVKNMVDDKTCYYMDDWKGPKYSRNILLPQRTGKSAEILLYLKYTVCRGKIS